MRGCPACTADYMKYLNNNDNTHDSEALLYLLLWCTRLPPVKLQDECNLTGLVGLTLGINVTLTAMKLTRLSLVSLEP